MPLDAAQLSWLSSVTGQPIALPGDKPGTDDETGADPRATLERKLEAEAVADEKRKALALADANRTIKPLKAALRDGFDLQHTDAKGNTEQFQGSDMGTLAEVQEVKNDSTISKGGSEAPKPIDGKPKQGLLESQKAFDQRQQKISEEMTARRNEHRKLVDDAKRALDVVMTLRNQLEAMVTTRSRVKPDGTLFDGPEQPLFSIAELMDELFTPLVRQKILPDTFITGTYSAVQKMLDGSNALYKEELKTVKDTGSSTALLKKAVDAGSAITGSVLEIVGVDSSLATTMLEGSTELVKLSIDFGEKLGKGADVKSVTDFLNGLPAIVGPMVGAALGDNNLGDLVKNAGSAGTKGLTAIVISIKERQAKPGLLIDFVSSIITVGLSEIQSSSDKQKAGVTLGDDLQGALSGVASAHADLFFQYAMKGDMAKARKEVLGVIKDVVLKMPSLTSDIKDTATSSSTTLTPDSDDTPKSKEDQAIGSGQDQFGLVKDSIQSSLDKREKLLEQLAEGKSEEFKKLSESVDQAAIDRQKLEADPVAFANDIEKQLDEERKAFAKELQGMGDILAAEKTIESLMAKIQRDRAIMSVALVIGKGGIEVASKFFAPLSLGTEAIKMASNIKAAVERAMDLRKFLETQRQARNAVSPYITSIQNFADNQANQLNEYSIRVALNGAKLAAAAAAMAFPAAAVAVPILSAVSSGTELLFDVHNEDRLKAAWKTTKLALDNPLNRKLGLQARRLNPTLAKYTVAYGAIIARDPTALQMCQACGLSLDTVANTDAKKVKAYLVLRFEEDGEVLHSYTDPTDWQADLPEPALSASAVFATYGVIKDAYGKRLLKNQPKGDIKPPGELATMVRVIGEDLPTGADAPTIEKRLMLVGQTVQGFRAEAERLGEMGEGVEETIGAFGSMADSKQQKLVMQLLAVKTGKSI